MSRRLYTIAPPVSMRGDLMLHGDFYVPDSRAGVKVAAWLDESTLEQREDLFKVAVEKDTRDLASAYNEMCSAKDSDDKAEATPYVELDDDDDYGQATFAEPDDDEG